MDNHNYEAEFHKGKKIVPDEKAQRKKENLNDKLVKKIESKII